MKLVQPIQDMTKIEELKSIFMHQSYRNYFFFVMAINSGITLEDILSLKVIDVEDKDFITIKKRTGEIVIYDLNDVLKQEISQYIKGLKSDDYLFSSRSSNNPKPITRNMVHAFLNEAAQQIGLSEISFLTLRKTFGWFHYQKHHDIKYLQEVFNHPAPSRTFKYLGIIPD